MKVGEKIIVNSPAWDFGIKTGVVVKIEWALINWFQNNPRITIIQEDGHFWRFMKNQYQVLYANDKNAWRKIL